MAKFIVEFGGGKYDGLKTVQDHYPKDGQSLAVNDARQVHWYQYDVRRGKWVHVVSEAAECKGK